MTPATASTAYLAAPEDYLALMKPRVMSLVIFTALIGMVLAPMTTHPLLLVISLLAIAAGAGAAGALNQWYDRDIDALMTRTANRPLPKGLVHADEALSLGVVVGLLSVLVLGFAGGFGAATLLGFTIFFYSVIYTIWLKRTTTQNIVIGGAAGAFPPAIGWLAAGGGIGVEPLLLFLMIFAWTPPHFWALALVRNDDYSRANVPMYPVVHGSRATKNQILFYAVLTALAGIAPAFVGMAGGLYLVLASVLGLRFVQLAVLCWRADDADSVVPMRLFRFSILYLFLLFLGLGLDATWDVLSGGAL